MADLGSFPGLTSFFNFAFSYFLRGASSNMYYFDTTENLFGKT